MYGIKIYNNYNFLYNNILTELKILINSNDNIIYNYMLTM